MINNLKNIFIYLTPYVGIIVILMLILISIILVIINVMDGRPPLPLNISYYCDTLKYYLLIDFKKDIFNLISKFLSKIIVFAEELPIPQDKPPTPEIPQNSNAWKLILGSIGVVGFGGFLWYCYSKGWDIFSGWGGSDGKGGPGGGAVGIDPQSVGSPSTKLPVTSSPSTVHDTTITTIVGNTTTAIITHGDIGVCNTPFQALDKYGITPTIESIRLVDSKPIISPNTPATATRYNIVTTPVWNITPSNPISGGDYSSMPQLEPDLSNPNLLPGTTKFQKWIIRSQDVICTPIADDWYGYYEYPIWTQKAKFIIWLAINNIEPPIQNSPEWVSLFNQYKDFLWQKDGFPGWPDGWNFTKDYVIIHWSGGKNPLMISLESDHGKFLRWLSKVRGMEPLPDTEEWGKACKMRFQFRELEKANTIINPIFGDTGVSNTSLVEPTASASISDSPIDTLHQFANNNNAIDNNVTSPAVTLIDPTLDHLSNSRYSFLGPCIIVPDADPSKDGKMYSILSHRGQFFMWLTNVKKMQPLLDLTTEELLTAKDGLMGEFNEWFKLKPRLLTWIITDTTLTIPSQLLGKRPTSYELSSEMARLCLAMRETSDTQFFLDGPVSEMILKDYELYVKQLK